LGSHLSAKRHASAIALGVVVAARAAAASSGYVATIHPLAAILRELVPNATRVSVPVPPGASPHTFEPRPSDLRAVQSARALFFVSSELDGWATRLPAVRKIAVLDRILPEHRLPTAPDGKGPDPQFWTDPVTVKASLPGLTDVLCTLEEADCAVVRSNAARFSAELERLDREVQELLEPVRGAPVVLLHPSFRYFLRRYGLDLAGVIEPSPGREPTPALSIELVATGIRSRWPGRLRPRDRTEALAALGQVGVAHLAFRPSGRLSGGELQRVYLARALVRRPRVVILEEPATGIDVAAEADVYRLLDTHHREAGTTIVMATHDLLAAHNHATHVLLVSQRQIAFGPPDVALAETHIRRAFSHTGHLHALPAQVTGRA
jgi:ABC-type Zn uptake system ZnuABC Zn-binding protein ZnuA